MAAPNPTKLDAGQVLQGAFDEETGRLRTDAEATIVNADIDVELTAQDSSVAIGDATTGITAEVTGNNELKVVTDANTSSMEVFQIDPDGLQTNAHLQVAGADVSNSNPVPVNIQNLPSDPATGANQVSANNLLTTLNGTAVSIDSKLPNLGQNDSANSLSVVLATDQAPIQTNVTLDAFTKPTVDNVQIVGSQDGTKSGAKFGVVYNKRQQILDSHDRIALFTYADFGTKNQRITAIEYTSATFSGVTIRREFTYTLVLGKYRRDSETWDEV
jgi:hypothetical protein